MKQKLIPWVAGNTLPLSVPLQTKTIVNGKWVTVDYVPPQGSEIHVYLVSRTGQRKEYEYTLDGNVISFTDPGTLRVGFYGVEVTVQEPSAVRRRTFKCSDIQIVACTNEVGILPDGRVILDAAVFVQGPAGKDGKDGQDGKDGKDGKDAEVTAENIERALSGTPLLAITEEELNEIFNL